MNKNILTLFYLCIFVTLLLIVSISNSKISFYLMLLTVFIWTVAIQELRLDNCNKKLPVQIPEK